MPTQTFFNLTTEKQSRIMDAAFEEFANNRFQNAKLSNIIKNAGIPRGSFYQYFDDKMDLYKYMFDLIGQKKMEYLSDDLKNPHNLGFFDLFRELYKTGMKFAYDHPNFVKITSLLLASKDFVYQEIFAGNIQVAVDFYKGMILKDQEAGRMDKNIDPDTLANIVINMTMNVAFEEAISAEGDKIDFDIYEKKIEKVLYIFEKGIKGTS